MVTNIDRRRVATMADRILKFHPTLTPSECWKRAWDLHWFRLMLANGIVHFRYYKENDDPTQKGIRYVLRKARGTLLMDVIPESKRPKGTSTREPNYKNMSYYDLDKDDWRSFDVTRFQIIERFIPKMRK